MLESIYERKKCILCYLNFFFSKYFLHLNSFNIWYPFKTKVSNRLYTPIAGLSKKYFTALEKQVIVYVFLYDSLLSDLLSTCRQLMTE